MQIQDLVAEFEGFYKGNVLLIGLSILMTDLLMKTFSHFSADLRVPIRMIVILLIQQIDLLH